MFKYTGFFVLLAVLFVQTTSAFTEEELNEKRWGLIDKANDYLKQVIDIAQRTFSDSVNTLKEFGQGIKENAEDIIGNFTLTIKGEVSKVEGQIDQLQKDAQALGINIEDCVNVNKANLENLGKIAAGKLIECVNNQVANVQTLVEKAISDVLALKDEIYSLPGALQDCINGGSSFSCLAGFIKRVISDITSVPNMAQDIVFKVIGLVNSAKNDLTTCALDKVSELGQEATDVASVVASCVTEKKPSTYY